MDGSVVGISAYLDSTPRAAIHGRIKQHAADFVVQEITIDGDVLELSSDSEQLPSQTQRDAVVQVMADARQSKQQRAKEPLVFDAPVHGWNEELRRLLKNNEALIAQLEHVATSAAKSDTQVVLDAPSDFRERVYLQVCIQHCFPALDCRMRKTTASTDSTITDVDSEAFVAMEKAQQIEISLDGLYKKFLNAGISVENATKLIEFVRKGATDPDATKGLELEHDDTKEARASLHRQLASASTLLKTRTETRSGQQRVVAVFSPQNTKKRKRADQPPVPLVRFVLRKTNLEHYTCMEKLSRWLKRPVSAFAYAGTKDKVAITYQHVTVQGVAPEQLLALNREQASTTTSSSSGLSVGCVEFVATPMSLGNLSGNRFSIVIRDLPLHLSDSDLRDRVLHIQRHGFINYFGFQRVGLPTSAVRPHQIGELIVAGKWEAAVKKLFAPSEQDPPECAAAKAAYLADNDDIDAVLKLVPQNSMPTERAVLMGLKRFGSQAWEQAIRNIPFARRTMYLHAYQSYLFNETASHRIKLSGANVLAGDLVRETSGADVAVATAEIAAQLNDRLETPLACVILPLPGSNVLYPTNQVGDKLHELLVDHNTASALKTSSDLKGAYRSLVVRPSGVAWQRLDDANAIKIQFSLSSGSFATMCLREILHSDM